VQEKNLILTPKFQIEIGVQCRKLVRMAQLQLEKVGQNFYIN